jgi:MGT family glycosyltransferase
MRNTALAVFTDVRRIAESWGADVVVSDLVDLGGLVAAESLGIPYASIGMSAGTARDLTDQLARPLTWLRASAGLPPDPDLTMLYRHLHLAFTPPSFDGPSASFPPTVCFLRRTGTVRSGERLPEWAEHLSRPLVLVSLGTVFHRLTEVYRSIVEVLRDEPVEVGVAVGFDQDPSCLGPQPANVHVEPWLPLPLLFPRCAALVTHGGFNSTMEALGAGVPLVVIPMAGDHPYCAQRCAELGVGRAIRPGERLPGEILEATRRVLAEPSYRRAALRFKAANAELPTADFAVQLLEKLVASHPPG